MLSVTEAAMQHLSGVLDDEDPGRVLRLTPTNEGLALVPDQPRAGDEVHEHGGKALLVVDETLSSAVDTNTLDVAVERGQATLTLR